MTERIVFCADVHLTPAKPEKTERFIRFLRGFDGSARAIYLLGDIFDVWIGWRHLHLREYGDVIRELRRLTDRGMRVYFVPGNRDFMVGKSFAKATGVKILHKGGEIKLGGGKVCFAHGDLLCTDDATSRRFNAVMRGEFGRRVMQPLYKLLPAGISYFLARGYSGHSNRVKKLKPYKVFDLAPAALKRLFERGCDVVICGHLHRPERREERFNGKTRTVFILSGWEKRVTYLEYAGGEFRLKTFE